MGQKVNPIGLRLGITRPHSSAWYAEGRDYADMLIMDYRIREYLRQRLAHASVSLIEIARIQNQSASITIHTARPGIVIGKKGEEVEALRDEIAQMLQAKINININEIRKPEIDACLVAQNIAQQLVRRVQFRRAMRRAIQGAMRSGAKGIKVRVAGRLGGADIARAETYREGRVPLHTLRADIDYATAQAKTTYGILGVKVWIFKGEIGGDNQKAQKAVETQGRVMEN